MVISLVREKLFSKDIYIINVRFEAILEPYKCQVGNIFQGFAMNPIVGLQSRSPDQSSEFHNLGLTAQIGNFCLTPWIP